MKFNQIAMAAAVLVAGVANAGLSAPQIATVNDANTNGRIISISGASGVQKGFTEVIARLFTGTPTYFSKASSSGGSFDKADFVGVAGTLATGTGAWAGQNAIVIYRVKGGSIYGVNSVARAELIDALNVTSAGCGTTGAGTAASPYDCPTNTRVPDAGVSDVAPALFKGPVNTEGEVAAESLTDAELSLMTPTALYGLAFGIPVTSTVPATTKFTRSLLSAIMTGNVGDWASVDGTSGDIMICRRTPGSGSQAVVNLWANNYPCSDTMVNFPADRDSSGAWDAGTRTFTAANGAGGLIVIENASSTDVVSCLDKAVTGGTYTTKDRDGLAVTVNMGAGGYKAVGVLSMDGLAKSKSTGNWQFRTLDGAGKITWDTPALATPPTLTGTGKFPTVDAGYENGDWDLQGWVSFNVPTRTTGNKLAVLDKFVSIAKDPAVLAATLDLKNVAAAIPGGAYTGSQVLDASYLNGNQCAPYSRNYND